jgi:hypothetical protein
VKKNWGLMLLPDNQSKILENIHQLDIKTVRYYHHHRINHTANKAMFRFALPILHDFQTAHEIELKIDGP